MITKHKHVLKHHYTVSRIGSYKVKGITNFTEILCQLCFFFLSGSSQGRFGSRKLEKKRGSPKKFGCWKSIANRGEVRRDMPFVSSLMFWHLHCLLIRK